jgi:hypothetical protein
MQRADAERPYRQPLDALQSERSLQLRRLGRVDEPPGEQQENRAGRKSSQRERKRARRGRVEPLDVVDGDEKRLLFAQKLEHVANRDRERAVINGIT